MRDDADRLFDCPVAPESGQRLPGSFPQELPSAWTEVPAAFEATAMLSTPQLEGRATLRYDPDHDPARGAVVGSVVWAWCPEGFQVDRLERTLDEPGAIEGLERCLRAWGDHTSSVLGEVMGTALGAPAAHRGEVIVLHGAASDDQRHFGELLADLSEEALHATRALSAAAALGRRRRAAIDPSGTWGHVRRGRFIAGRQTHAV